MATVEAGVSKLPPKDCDEHEFNAWVRSATERADPLTAWLGALFALVEERRERAAREDRISP